MQEKITGIVIDIVKHSDRHNVLTLFTRERGRVAFLAPLGKTQKARMRLSRLAPLAVVGADVNFKGTRDLQFLPDVTPVRVWRTLYFNPVKSSLVMFLMEFLNRLLRSEAPDPASFDFIIRSLEILDADGPVSPNFHIAFLLGMMHPAGIAPFAEGYESGYCFDMRAAQYARFRPMHSDYIPAALAGFLPLLLRMNFRNMSAFRFSGDDRSRILGLLLRYYAVHLPGVASLKSPDILRDLFH